MVSWAYVRAVGIFVGVCRSSNQCHGRMTDTLITERFMTDLSLSDENYYFILALTFQTSYYIKRSPVSNKQFGSYC